MSEHLSRGAASASLESPRFEQQPPLLIAGLRTSVTGGSGAIPALWARFAPHFGRVPGAVDRIGYGVCLAAANGDADCCDYVAGCAVVGFDGIPADWARVNIPAQRYAVFPHRHHVARLPETIDAIFNRWLPASGNEAARAGPEAVGFFERYGEGFDPNTGSGDIEVWVPVQA